MRARRWNLEEEALIGSSLGGVARRSRRHWVGWVACFRLKRSTSLLAFDMPPPPFHFMEGVVPHRSTAAPPEFYRLGP